MYTKPQKVYHGSSNQIDGSLQPILKQDSPDHIHTRASVFATERIDVASLFMFPFENIASIGLEQDIAYICIWGTHEEFISKDRGGFMYVLPGTIFEKIGKEYEWQSFSPVVPLEVRKYDSVIDGIMECGAQVYFINDDPLFDRIVADKDNRAPILKELISENQEMNINPKIFK